MNIDNVADTLQVARPPQRGDVAKTNLLSR